MALVKLSTLVLLLVLLVSCKDGIRRSMNETPLKNPTENPKPLYKKDKLKPLDTLAPQPKNTKPQDSLKQFLATSNAAFYNCKNSV